MGTASDEHIYRPNRTNTGLGMFSAALILLSGVALLTDPSFGNRTVGALLVATGAWLAVAFPRMRVLVTPGALVVRSLWTRRVPWSSIYDVRVVRYRSRYTVRMRVADRRLPLTTPIASRRHDPGSPVARLEQDILDHIRSNPAW
jgi:hypothetical protein